MGNTIHREKLEQGKKIWNAWRKDNPEVIPNFSNVDLANRDFSLFNLSGTNFVGAGLSDVKFVNTNLSGANFGYAELSRADFRGANLRDAKLIGVALPGIDLSFADLTGANLHRANLMHAILYDAKLIGANLIFTSLTGANFENADLTGCSVYGCSAWNVKLRGALQRDLIITPEGEQKITVDNLEVAQFIYLLLNNERIRDVINTIGRKGVLILGRFTERKNVLEALRVELRRRDYVPIVFDFERPNDRDFTETVMTLAGMCLFIIADMTKPKSVPYELAMTVPNFMIPFVPIIQEGEEPFAMFVDLWKKFRGWVLEPLVYDSVEELREVFDRAVLEPVKQRHQELEVKKAEELVTRHAKDYQ